MPTKYQCFALTAMFYLLNKKTVFGAQLAEYLLCASVTDFTYLYPVMHYLLQSETHFYLKISVPTCKILCSY